MREIEQSMESVCDRRSLGKFRDGKVVYVGFRFELADGFPGEGRSLGLVDLSILGKQRIRAVWIVCAGVCHWPTHDHAYKPHTPGLRHGRLLGAVVGRAEEAGALEWVD